MITPDELTTYIISLKTAGVTGKVKIGDIEVTIMPEVSTSAPPPKRRSAEYDSMLFAATEGIRDDDDEVDR